MKQPAPLQPGDRVQMVAASSALIGDAALARLDAGISVFEGWGLEVKRPPLVGRSWGYLAGRDQAIQSRTATKIDDRLTQLDGG